MCVFVGLLLCYDSYFVYLFPQIGVTLSELLPCTTKMVGHKSLVSWFSFYRIWATAADMLGFLFVCLFVFVLFCFILAFFCDFIDLCFCLWLHHSFLQRDCEDSSVDLDLKSVACRVSCVRVGVGLTLG